VVYNENGRSVGLVIDRILDIVEESFQIQPNTRRPGVLGSAVIQKRTTGVLDIRGLLAAAENRLQVSMEDAQARALAEESQSQVTVAETPSPVAADV